VSTAIKIAVLTDLHAYAETPTSGKPSWLCTTADQNNPKINPFAGAQSLVKGGKWGPLSADVVICCGDLGDKAHPDAQQYAWREVHALATCLGAGIVIGTAGNHDVDSRYEHNDYDAKGQLLSLRPRFPIDDETKWLEYWAKNYTTLDVGLVRFLALNSAAYHGGGKSQAEEFEHGRVSNSTLDSIIADLDAQGPRPANILICHHHPYKNDVIKLDDYSGMRDGDLLINRLSSSNLGPWMVIHGHKHLPRLFYALGGNLMPTIFSAGSFAARLYPELQDLARNEFYIIELEVPPETGLVSSLRGRIKAWQWSYGNGWIQPQAGVGLGREAAFGARADLGTMASSVAGHLKTTSAGQAVPWGSITAFDTGAGYLIPEDLKHFLELLQTKHSIRVLRDDQSGELVEVQVP